MCTVIEDTHINRGVVKGEQEGADAPGHSPEGGRQNLIFPHFCLLDRYLMQFLQVIYIHYICQRFWRLFPHTQL